MSIDNVSQTSDYSSCSEKSARRPSLSIPCNVGIQNYGSSTEDNHFIMEGYYSSITKSNGLNSPQSCSAVPEKISCYDNTVNLSFADSLETRMKDLIVENSKLKKEVTTMRARCSLVEDCEKQFSNLQTQYEGFVKSSTNRHALEQRLRRRLEAELLSSKDKQSKTVKSVHTQTHRIVSKDQDLLKEISALRLMLREKEELILSLLDEREKPQELEFYADEDDDYIASNIVSL